MNSTSKKLMAPCYHSNRPLPLPPPPIMNGHGEFLIPMEDPNYPKALGDPNYPQVVFHTTMGDITFKFHRNITMNLFWTPKSIDCEKLYMLETRKTARNFLELTRRAYYNSVSFHRVIKGFMIQSGDPTGTGRGGESIYGGKFEDDVKRELRHTRAGLLSMANAGPNTNGSQFLITLAPTPWLDFVHTIFGEVVKGMDVVKRISIQEVDKLDRPIHDVRILKTRIIDEIGQGDLSDPLPPW